MVTKQFSHKILISILIILPLSACSINFNASKKEQGLIDICEEQSQAISRDAKRIQDIREIRQALSFYFINEQAYPDSLTARKPLKSKSQKTTYMTLVPRDLDGEPYFYATSSNSQSYKLTYTLESGLSGNPSLAGGKHNASPSHLTNQSLERLQEFNNVYKIYQEKCFPGSVLTEYQTVEKAYQKRISDQTELNLITQAKRRDTYRINSIKALQVGLNMYFSDEGEFPKELNFSKPLTGPTNNITFIHTLEQNPSPGGKDYEYRSFAKDKYSIFFSLEEGVDNYLKGDYITTSQNVVEHRGTLSFKATLKKDSDLDGLYDSEEVLYKTDPSQHDTDQDTYSDLEELKNGYNPTK